MGTVQQLAASADTGWDCLNGELLDARFKVGELLQTDRIGAWFSGHDQTDASGVFVFMEREDRPGAEDDFNRYREAAFFNHPNLLRVFDTGRTVCNGQGFFYLVTETAQSNLAEEMRRGPISVDEASNLLRHIAAGLAYLHSENLVHCAVHAGAVWKVNSQWKLADYTQLRVAGQYRPQETRSLVVVPALECPPEAHEGIVSPAWDVWSLGSVLQRVLPKTGNLQQPLPPPFDTIVPAALEPDRQSRSSLAAMVSELDSYHPPAAPTEPDAIPAPPPALPKAEQPIRRTAYDLPVETSPRAVTRGASSERRPFNYRSPVVPLSIFAVMAIGALGLAYLKNSTRPQVSRPRVAASTSIPAQTALPDNTSQNASDSRPSPFGDSNAASPAPPQVQKQIANVLDRWADAKRRRNVDEAVQYYTPVLDRFYGQRNLSAEQLKRQQEDVLSRIGTIQKFEISNIKFQQLTSDSAVVSLDKKWDFRGRSRFAGSSREELVLRPIGGHWRISSEREVKVYWINKQPT